MTGSHAENDDHVDLAPDPNAPDPLIGRVVDGKYKIKRLIGSGGMGAVYEAFHQTIGKRVAVKVLHREYASDVSIVQRFQREARAATSIGHPNIVDVYDMGTLEGGGFFQVLELLSGRSLADEIEQTGPLPYGRAARILMQVADALAATHEKGIIHRDLKPDNVFLVDRPGDRDFVKLLDFGVAKMADPQGAKTHTGMAIGTPAYMSPEQAQGARDIDHRTDIFALGVMTFELLAGVRPFRGDSYATILFQICVGEAPRLSDLRADVPAGFEGMLDRMLAKRRDERFADCREVKAALAPYAALDASPVLRGSVPDAGPIPLSAIQKIASGPTVAGRPAARAEAAHASTGAMQTGAMGAPESTPISGEVARVPTPAMAPSAMAPMPNAAMPNAATPSAAMPNAAMPSAAMPTGGPSREVKLIAAVALSGLAVAAAIFAWQLAGPSAAPDATAVTPAALAPSTVRIALRAEPASAELFVDDVRVANPYVAELPSSPEPHLVEARLEGYATSRRAVTYERAIDVTLALAPSSGSTAAPTPTAPTPAAETAPAAVESPHATGRHHGGATTTSAPATTAAAPPATPSTSAPPPSREAPPSRETSREPEHAAPADEPAPARALKTVVF